MGLLTFLRTKFQRFNNTHYIIKRKHSSHSLKLTSIWRSNNSAIVLSKSWDNSIEPIRNWHRLIKTTCLKSSAKASKFWELSIHRLTHAKRIKTIRLSMLLIPWVFPLFKIKVLQVTPNYHPQQILLPKDKIRK